MKDKQALSQIKQHYNDILEEQASLNNDFELFKSNKTIQKAIKMDVFQIGEIVNKLSEKTKGLLNERDVRGIVNVRNFIAHTYVIVDDLIIWDSINNDIPKLINELEQIVDKQ